MRAAVLIAVVLLALAVRAEAQSQGKVAKIGWLSARRSSNSGQETIVGMLRDLGYVEGKNVTIEYRWAEGRHDRLQGFAADLVSPDVATIRVNANP